MFLGRESELRTLEEQFTSARRTAVLVYGKRRVGKSTLVAKAAQGFEGVVIEHLCVRSTFEGNLKLLSRSVSMALGLPSLNFDHIYDLFDFLKGCEERILLILDEYQYLKQSLRGDEVDSYLQAVIDSLPAHVKLVLCGSYITIMKELLEEGNPLFGRFSAIMHVKEFDYLDAALFYPEAKPYEKVALYGVFGGSPFVLSSLDFDEGLRGNVIKLLLPETGVLHTHVENVMLQEVRRSYDVRILEALGNGKKRYSEIQAVLGGAENGLLGKQLSNLESMETVRKTMPINRRKDKRKLFYEISDNLMRFYFAYVFGNTSLLAKFGPQAFFENRVSATLTHFISRRFEEVCIQYFMRLARMGRLGDVLDFGSYWYDDPRTKTNGEFDCVLQRPDGLDFYECKYYDRPMTLQECEEEERQVHKVPGAEVKDVGFICTGGFDFEHEAWRLIAGEELYDLPREA